MITEDYVSFETAKLLKEKGFDEECSSAFYKTGRIVDGYDSEFSYNYYDRPTLQIARKWLREKHNLHIEIRITNDSMSDMINVVRYYWVMLSTETGKAKWCDESTVYTVKLFNKSEEAEEDAIRRALEKLT